MVKPTPITVSAARGVGAERAQAKLCKLAVSVSITSLYEEYSSLHHLLSCSLLSVRMRCHELNQQDLSGYHQERPDLRHQECGGLYRVA